MTTTVSIRELSRNTNILANYDYIEIEDRKTHEFKGLFVSPHLAVEVKKFIEEKLENEKRIKIDKLIKFAGFASGDTKNLDVKEIQKLKNEKYSS